MRQPKMIRVTDPGGVTWHLPDNDLWTLPPKGIHEVQFEIETRQPWGMIVSLRGLVIDEDGYLYGIRSMQKIRQNGYALDGKVSVGGIEYRVFTTSKMFERSDGSLCNVAVLYLCCDDHPAPYPEERSCE